MRKILFAALVAALSLSANAQVSSMLGKWTTIDDKSNEPKSEVEIFKANDGLYYGRITHLYLKSDDAVCEACEGADKGKKLVGMNIIRGMKEEDGALVGGRILDPESGKTYYAKMTLKDGKLVLRGSLDKRGFLGRSQTWVRK